MASGMVGARSCNLCIIIFGENGFPKRPTGYSGLVTQQDQAKRIPSYCFFAMNHRAGPE